MIRIICCGLLFVLLTSCKPKPFRVEKLSPKKQAPIAQTDTSSFAVRIDEALAERYKKKKSPSFAVINGYYRLPEAKPYGAANIVRAYSYQTYFEGITVSKDRAPDVITPLLGDDAIAFEKALNALLDKGVIIKEISMTDALAIAKAEQQAIKQDKVFLGGTALPPNVDYLISIYPSYSKTDGPVLIGRVIKRDGTLMAFRVVHRGSSRDLVASLITTLFEDTINRI